MKTIAEKIVKGKRRVTVDLDEGEQLVPIKPNRHYRLGYPIDDVVPSHVMQDITMVFWDCVGQKWEDVR